MFNPNMMFGGMLGNMMFGGMNPLQALFGGPPPSGRSHVSEDFDQYMLKAVSAPFPHTFHDTASRTVNIWNGRRIKVCVGEKLFAKVKGSKNKLICLPLPPIVQGTIVSVRQFNTSPFQSTTDWSMEIQYDDIQVTNYMLDTRYNARRKKNPTTVNHILHRCHPYRGGTFHRDSRSEHSTVSDTPSNEGDGPLISFTFIDDAYPNIHLVDGPPCPICRRPNTPSAYPYAPYVHDISETKDLNVDTTRHRAFSVARERLNSFYNTDDVPNFESSSSSSSSSSTKSTSSNYGFENGEVILNRPDDLEQPLGFEFKIDSTSGQMLISAVHPDGLADKAGLQSNDIITHINKEWIVEVDFEDESKKKITKKQKRTTEKRVLALCHQQPVVSLVFLRGLESSSSSSSSPSPSPSSSSTFHSSSFIKGECPICMDDDVNCVKLDCGHKCCYGCWSEWCAQQDDDSDDRSGGAQDAEAAVVDNMHVEASEHIESDLDSLGALRAAKRYELDDQEKDILSSSYNLFKHPNYNTTVGFFLN